LNIRSSKSQEFGKITVLIPFSTVSLLFATPAYQRQAADRWDQAGCG
jgi:hypothetical protein